MIPENTLREYLEAAREAARCGAEVLEHWRTRFQVREKGRFDLVTEADLASQRTIFEFLGRRFPGHAFLGEEDGVADPQLTLFRVPTTADNVWRGADSSHQNCATPNFWRGLFR